jgi:outer membrane protein assembly factor BamB
MRTIDQLFSMQKLCILSFMVVSISVFSFSYSLAQNQSKEIVDFHAKPTIKWQFKTHAPIYASPIENEAIVYFGGLDSIFYALDVHTGKEIWRFHTRGEIRSNACIDGSRIYFNGGDGNIYALNKKNGKLIWRFQTQGERKYDFADYFHSTPVLKKGILYFGSGDENFYAVDAESGTLNWSFKSGNIIHTTPAIDKDKVFFGSFDGYVYALSLTKGELIWKFKTVGHRYFPAGEVQGSLAAGNNLVFIGARDYNVYALDQEKGYCHWNKSFTHGWGLCNNLHDSVLYIGSADERVLIAANPLTGEEYWRVNMEFLVFGNNAYSQNLMYMGTTNGRLHAFNRATGKKLWSFETSSYQENKSKYFKPDGSYRDDIYSIIRSNEQFLEVECELGGVFSTPVLLQDTLIFTSTNGTLYCLSR